MKKFVWFLDRFHTILFIEREASRRRTSWAQSVRHQVWGKETRRNLAARKVRPDLAKSVYKLNNTDQTTFFSPIDARSMPAFPSKLPEDREFVVDSGASMHMLCKKDLSSDEMDTLRRSRNPTTVVTANGEVQTNEDAQVYVHDLDLFVAVQLLEDTPAVLSLGSLFEENGYSYEWSRGQKTMVFQKGRNS